MSRECSNPKEDDHCACFYAVASVAGICCYCTRRNEDTIKGAPLLRVELERLRQERDAAIEERDRWIERMQKLERRLARIAAEMIND